MAKTEAFTCDVCGAAKREANHWWRLDVELVQVNKDVFDGAREALRESVLDGLRQHSSGACIAAASVNLQNALEIRRLIRLHPWEVPFRDPNEEYHLCGQACVLRKVSELMEGK